MEDEKINDVGGEELAGQSLDELLNPSLENDEQSTTQVEDTKKQDVTSTANVDEAVRKATEKFEDKVSELTQSLQYTRGELAEVKGRSEKPLAKSDEPLGEFKIDEEAIAKEMETNAPAALMKFAREFMAHELKRLKTDVTKDVDGKVNADRAQRQMVERYNEDRNGVLKDYPEAQNDETFKNECNSEMANIIRNRGGSKWEDYQPGDLYNAATRVAFRWTKQGKMNKVDSNSNGNGANGLSLKEIVRRAPSSVANGNGNGRQTSGSPKTIDELFPDSPRDRAIARKIQKGYGVTEEAYVKQLIRARQEDSDYVG